MFQAQQDVKVCPRICLMQMVWYCLQKVGMSWDGSSLNCKSALEAKNLEVNVNNKNADESAVNMQWGNLNIHMEPYSKGMASNSVLWLVGWFVCWLAA